MSWLIRLLLPVVLGLVGKAIAHQFEGSCPLDAGTWTCVHWETVCTVAAAILGVFGVTVKRPKKDETATIKQGLRVVHFPPAPKPHPSMPDAGGTEVPDAEWVGEKTDPGEG